MAHNDPDIWRAIERLTVVMERLDSKNVGVETGPWTDFLKSKSECPGNWNKGTSELSKAKPVPVDGPSTDQKHALIVYHTERVAELTKDVSKIQEDYKKTIGAQVSAAKAAVNAVK